MRHIIDDSLRSVQLMTRGGVIGRFLVFSAVGAVGGAAHYLILIVTHEALDVNPVIASAMGSIAGACVNYLLNYHVTFESDVAHVSVMPKFFLIASVGFLLNLLVVWQMVDHFKIHYIGSQLVATGVVLAWGFASNSMWAFNKSQ